MNERSINVLGKLVFITIMVVVFTPATVLAQQDADTRIGKLESQLKALQNELAKLKAERAAPPVDKKQVETMVDKILAERPSPDLGPTDFRVFWKEGLNLESGNGDFKLKMGGRIMHDWTWVGEDDALKADVGEQEDGTEFRRVRFYTSGIIYDNTEFKLQFDFAGRDADLKDAYIGLKDFPIGSIRAGHFKEPFGLEELTSSKYINFLERALPMEAFAPSRNAGVMLFDSALDERMTWAVGIFRDTDDDGDIQDDGGYNFTGRVTALPWYTDKGASLLHIGAAYSQRNPNAESAQYRSRPEAHLLDRFVDTGTFGCDRADLLGLEAAWVSGPLSVQGEYVFADADQTSGLSSANFDGYYIQANYFLTGEHRNYKTSSGTFSRTKPKENFSFGGGPGAWEVAFRYSGLDLNDSGLSGGELDTVTTGLNWYLNPNTRIMWNYVRADKDSVGNADMLLMRFQVDF